jgi:uncharacterized protein (TIGR03086 family)
LARSTGSPPPPVQLARLRSRAGESTPIDPLFGGSRDTGQRHRQEAPPQLARAFGVGHAYGGAPLQHKAEVVGDQVAALDDSARAWATVDDDAEQVPVPLPQGPMPAWLAAGACALDAAVHAWDIAVATGRPSPLTPEMAVPLMEVATRIVEPLRAYGAYAPAIETGDDAGDDAGAVAALLAYLGRRPI